MKWENEKNELERLINEEHVSYEEIGRRYGCTGSNIKKVAYRLGIELPKRRAINDKETFNRGTAKKSTCRNCGKEFILYRGTKGIYCCHECQQEYQYKEWVKKWKKGEETGLSGKYWLSDRLRRYMLEKNDCKCEKCGYNTVNPYTGKPILQIHHIDGNCLNNKEENLQLLCPNYHCLTENFGSRNKNTPTARTEYFGSSKKWRKQK